MPMLGLLPPASGLEASSAMVWGTDISRESWLCSDGPGDRASPLPALDFPRLALSALLGRSPRREPPSIAPARTGPAVLWLAGRATGGGL